MERAYVLINCDLGSEKQVIEEIKNLKNVKEVHGTLGSYDIIATVESKTPENVRQTVIGQIRKFDHIRSTLTLMGIESVKKNMIKPPMGLDEDFDHDDFDEEDEEFRTKKK